MWLNVNTFEYVAPFSEEKKGEKKKTWLFLISDSSFKAFFKWQYVGG